MQILNELLLFVTDLHGRLSRYRKLFQKIEAERPAAVFIGGDLLPFGSMAAGTGEKPMDNFIDEFLIPEFVKLKNSLAESYPRVFIILGNDDQRSDEPKFISAEAEGIWEYIHNKKTEFAGYDIYGYACVPPTPFQLKDWERYDVSRYVDPGCISPEEGWRTVFVPANKIKFATIKEAVNNLAGEGDLSKAVFLFHTPPYKTKLDRTALDGKSIDHVPLDVHTGSIAVRKFIEQRQPLLTLHGHIHESSRLTGSWQDKIGNTICFNAAIEKAELSIIKFELENLESAERELV